MAKVIPQESKMFKLLQWNTVAMWAYGGIGETCAICKNPINEACITCQGDQENNENKKCPKTIGICNHAFHSHCIDSWIKKQNNCPTCFKDWQAAQFIE